ncbi:hypothetical protein N0V90_004493 [Kalmusia sp. IMI 367209]|nr:hypothetical protein N0V90_004493 [Kalmusia sp. IMI 367209]
MASTQDTMSSKDHFVSSPDWSSFAIKNNIPLPSNSTPGALDKIKPIQLDYKANRVRQLAEHAQWRADHPLSSVGYASHEVSVTARDGHALSIKISYPHAARLANAPKKPLPVLFVTFGGGWIQGTHTTEECWLLWPLYPSFDVVIVSVNYRVGPENEAPIWVEDSWDVLQKLFSGTESAFRLEGLEMDLGRVILAGSSAGAGISAALSQRCRDEKLPLFGVVLNVPVLCDYRHFEKAEAEAGVSVRSYESGTEAILPSGAMMWIWNTLYPSPENSRNPTASPLLGSVEGLPRHLIFAAGQDALYDEAIAYATKLRNTRVKVHVEIYEGVPHIFAEFWELEATKRFWGDIRKNLEQWFGEA